MSESTPEYGRPRETPPTIETTVPHSARVWNYWLGGKDYFPADREAGDRFRETFPAIVDEAREGRAFLARTVTFLTAEAGVRQFLDIGTGMPTANNTHEVAQAVAADAHIVYVDNDPLVLAHARALLVGTEEGSTDYIHADLREPEAILEAARHRLDFAQPIGLMLLGVLGHIGDEEVYAVVRHLVEGLPPGSYLTLYDGADTNPAGNEAIQDYNEKASSPYRRRTPEQIAAFFDGLELMSPGIVPCPRWRPESTTATPRESDTRGGVGRKPAESRTTGNPLGA